MNILTMEQAIIQKNLLDWKMEQMNWYQIIKMLHQAKKRLDKESMSWYNISIVRLRNNHFFEIIL
jgi:hypothetical protein